MFGVATQRDTVSPWRSVYKMGLLLSSEVTFCLTTGGHNVGVVNPPGPGVPRSYQLATRAAGATHLDADCWSGAAPTVAGSWWPAWAHWLAAHGGKQVAPPAMGGADADLQVLDSAPGRYILIP